MPLILGLDFETTGLDPKQDRIIEIGAVLWDTERSAPLQLLSALVNPERPIPTEISELTGITQGDVDRYAISERAAFAQLASLSGHAEWIMAHNGTLFDRPFFQAAEHRLGLTPCPLQWLDSRTDIRYPDNVTARKLTHLAAEHQFLNPWGHRAVFDVLTMLRVASNYPIADTIARAQEPTVIVRAIVSYDDREKAKASGYHWHPESKQWRRVFKQSDYLLEKEKCGFPTREVTL